VGELRTSRGVTQGVIGGVDSFMRTLNFEMKNRMDVITCRGSVEQCFKDLGKKPVSE
jgi:hypothetical protein